MSRTWEKNRTDGRMCLVIDPEDGTQPMRVYGKDEGEIIDKMANTVEHSTRHIAALKTQPAAPARAATPPPAPRKSLSADERMTLTADLQNPGKAPAALKGLLNDVTGGAVDQMEADATERRRQNAIDRFAALATNWVLKHPEFPRQHPANKKMLADACALRVGLENVTEDVLQSVFLELLEGNHLVQDADIDSQEQNPAVQPEENPAPRTARSTQATMVRRSNLRATPPAPAPTQPRYTREQVDSMTAEQLLQKINSEQGFADIVAGYASAPRKATA